MRNIQQTLDKIAVTYLERSGEETCLQLTEATDSVLLKAASHFPPEIGLIAVGGYGRRELSRYSDIDLLIIYPKSAKDDIQALIRQFLHPLWDARLDVKHSVHTLSEIKSKVTDDSDFASAIIDYRILKKESKATTKFREWIQKYFTNPRPEFVETKLRESKSRRNKFGDTYKLLEPNIKESAGGLRDLHTLHWIAVGSGLIEPGVSAEDSIGTSKLTQWMVNEEYATTREYAAIKDAYNFLLQVRHGMHNRNRSKSSKSNFLDINIRHYLAEEFGYMMDSEPDVQAFMQAYYRAAREIEYSHNFFLQEQLHRDADPASPEEVYPLEQFPGFQQTNGMIIGNDGTQIPQSPVMLVRLFILAQEYQLQFSSEARQKIEQLVHSMDDEAFQTPEIGRLLTQILCKPDAGEILRLLLFTEILVKIIPEIAKIRRLHIQSMYHHYTVDEHTFRAIDTLQEAVFDSSSDDRYDFQATYRALDDPAPLCLALLLHDFGKSVDRDEHPEAGSDLVEDILTRLGLQEYVTTVQTLIREHLAMEQHAFRRDVNREKTIESFANIVGDEELLRMLYLLTYSDISAVNPDLWTDWKATLLFELYWKVLRYLRNEPIRPLGQQQAEISAPLRGEMATHTDEMGFRYTAMFAEEEIQEHLQAIQNLKDADNAKSVIVRQSTEVGFTKITVLTYDRPKLLSTICGVLTSKNCDIIDASIFTRQDGIAIDQFRVIAIGEKTELDEHLHEVVEITLEQVFAGELTTGRLIRQAERRWRWQKKQKNRKSPHFQWSREEHHIVLEVTGQDRVGLLYYLTKIIAETGFDIHSAKIHTEDQQITDIFYLSAQTGGDITSPEAEELLEELQSELANFLE
ncbi:MAG: Bifunctional uridylyltransferase/uridylyl-removing enzyme [Candidatus Marinimicrobia bacterium]|nr:Bifunctional uridylyltransferase/uridylyl-removing enzyme [Candidatus Neomarinimicrobiota bacterium]